jgi:hypothetical protein
MQGGTYSFIDVQASITGRAARFRWLRRGHAEEGITVAMANDKNTMTVGSDGRAAQPARRQFGQITLRYLKTAP